MHTQSAQVWGGEGAFLVSQGRPGIYTALGTCYVLVFPRFFFPFFLLGYGNGRRFPQQHGLDIAVGLKAFSLTTPPTPTPFFSFYFLDDIEQ
jgi:hypothetical protein